MKRFCKFFALIVSMLLACSTFFACGRGGRQENKVDETKVQLLVGYMKGGFGDGWITDAISHFEEKYKDVTFADGKVGVQVTPISDTVFSGSAISSKIATWPQHIVMCENLNFYDIVDKDALVDISDTVNSPINKDMITGQVDTSFGTGNDSIADIMNESMKSYFNLNGSDVYYGIPYYEATVGIVYDIDLFEKYGFFYAAEGYGDSDGFIQDKDGNWIGQNGAIVGNASTMTFAEALEAGVKLGLGPDNVESAYDDGMPATYDDFFKLCERMTQRNVTPLIWPGDEKIQNYLNYFAYNLWTDYEGRAQMSLNFDFNGRALDLIDIESYDSANGTYRTYEEDIDMSKGYLLQKQAGKYESINFVKRLVSNEKYYDSKCFSSTSQKEMERSFLMSTTPDGKKPIAMMIDGSWWQSEANNAFEDIVIDYGSQYSKQNRRFGMMALPKANTQKLGPATRAFNTSSAIMLNKKAINKAENSDEVLKVAKQFVKFLHTHESFYNYNRITSACRPYNYSLSEEELSGLTHVGRHNYSMHTSTDFIFSYAQNNIIKRDYERFSASGYLVYQSGGGMREVLTTSFHDSPNLSAWDYFKSMVNDHGEAFWETNYGNFYN